MHVHGSQILYALRPAILALLTHGLILAHMGTAVAAFRGMRIAS